MAAFRKAIFKRLLPFGILLLSTFPSLILLFGHNLNQLAYAKRMMRLGSSTVEPVPGTLINFTGMRRIYTRGIKGANKFMLGAAIAYNLKKLMKWGEHKRISACRQIEIQALVTKESS